MNAAELEQKIAAGIEDAEVSARDLHGTGDHFEVRIVSKSFEGKSPVVRHRMVYAALGDSMRAEIHALMIEAMDPDEFKNSLTTIGSE